MRNRQRCVLQVGTVLAMNVLFCPALFAAPATTTTASNTRATLNAINAKIENKFIEKHAAAHSKHVPIHDSKPYESEPIIFGSTQRQKGNDAANISGYHVKSGGVGYLFDYNLPTKFDLFELGAGATYSESHSKIAVSDTLNSNYGQILGYTNLVHNGCFVGVFVSGSENWNKSKRVVSSTALEARARYKGSAFFSKARLGYMARLYDWQFVPEATLQYIHLRQKGYNETGADTSNLSVSSSAADGVRSGIGGRVMYIQPSVTTEVRAFYLRDLKNPLLKPSFTFSSGASFAPGAQNNKKNTLNLGTSLKYFIRQDLSLTGNYDFLVKQQGYTENNVSLSMCWNF